MSYSYTARAVHLVPDALARKASAIAIHVRIKRLTLVIAKRNAGELSSTVMSPSETVNIFAHSACGPSGTGCSCKKGSCNCDTCENKAA
jgi:hypothetical protein